MVASRASHGVADDHRLPPLWLLLMMLWICAVMILFEDRSLETRDGVIFNGIAQLNGVAAHFTVLDVTLLVNGEIYDDRNLFPTIGTGEGMFHGIDLYPIPGSAGSLEPYEKCRSVTMDSDSAEMRT
jgi:hypothetical protein